MELTGIGSENEAAFSHLMPGIDIRDCRVAVGAIEEGRAAGVALYNDLDEALILDYIFVAEEYRRRGIGTALIEDFLEEIKDSGAAALHVNYPEKEKALHGFFSSLGFLLYRDGDCYRVSLKKLLKSERLNRLLKAEPKHLVCPVRELSKTEKQVLKNAMREQNLDENILDSEGLTAGLCLASLDDQKKPVACILGRVHKKEIAILYLVNFSKDPMMLTELLRVFRDAVMEVSYRDSELIFVTMDDKMKRFAEILLEDKEALVWEGKVISAIRMILEEDDNGK